MFNIGDRVRLRGTDVTGKLIGKGTLPITTLDNTTWLFQPDTSAPSVAVLPEEIEEIEPLDS